MAACRRPVTVAAVAAAAAWIGGCGDPGRAIGLDQPDPAARVRAVRAAAEEPASEDAAAMRELIEALANDDPAVRLLAIRALERKTGQTLGYEHWQSADKRDEALKRWLNWYSGTYGPMNSDPP